MYQYNVPLPEISKFAKIEERQIQNVIRALRQNEPLDPPKRYSWSRDEERLKIVEAAFQHYSYNPTFNDVKSILNQWGFIDWSDAIIRFAVSDR
eukprot:UN07391